MATNTYLPHVGGVARSVAQFCEEYRAAGHNVLVLAPEFEGQPQNEPDVVRLPAIQNFNGSDFSVRLPVPAGLSPRLQKFKPDIVHSHHPFLMGDTAVRIAAEHDVPLVFTHHTMYEQYTHYVPGDSPQVKEYAIQLATSYANLADLVFAPSDSVKEIIISRGVESTVQVVPTGVVVEEFSEANGMQFRREHKIPSERRILGHVGRLAAEKNLAFLAEAAIAVLRKLPDTHFVLVGDGPLKEQLKQQFSEAGLLERASVVGSLSGEKLTSAYHAINLFLFSSLSETQGMVLIEAMAAECPVVALDAPGAREVVIDGVNGRLLPKEDLSAFINAVLELLDLPDSAFKDLQEQALTTAHRYSSRNTAALALNCYEKILRNTPIEKELEGSEWLAALRRLEVEWELISAHARAAEKAFQQSNLGRSRPVRRVLDFARHVRRLVNRGEWSIRLLGLEVHDAAPSEPGLVLIQIDGLSRAHLNQAVASGKLPFIRRLLRKEGYRAHGLYSGLPSTTPTAQGELFYGKRFAVPSFAFFQPGEEVESRMFEPTTAKAVQDYLEQDSEPLLKDGSSYSNIYTGGAAEANFCCASMGWNELLRNVTPRRLFSVLVWHAGSILRCLFLVIVELILALGDCIRGISKGHSLATEISFIPTRVAICILLREAVTSCAIIDAVRGLPIIQVNFLGYDEQAHRRGPDSRFALWTLKGIDGCINRIRDAAMNSPRRDYDVWIYSDHGQEESIPYQVLTGESLEVAVRRVFGALKTSAPAQTNIESVQLKRSRLLGGIFSLTPGARQSVEKPAGESLRIAAMGPFGHIYSAEKFSDDERLTVAMRLVEAQIPLVVFNDQQGNTKAVNKAGVYSLPGEAERVFGKHHRFLRQVAEDLVEVSRHRFAGDFIISGWRIGDRSVSFPLEAGSHGGPGPTETYPFAVVPQSTPLYGQGQAPLRLTDLRRAALEHLGRIPKHSMRPVRQSAKTSTLRVMSYNVHHCTGMDGKLSPRRIARLISNYNPDIVALQELEVRRERSEHLDQVQKIAQELEMSFHFHPALEVLDARYGVAIVSRLPMRLVKSGALPAPERTTEHEPPGALWVELDIEGMKLYCLNTSLGLGTGERIEQAQALVGDDWLGAATGPTILCGDLKSSGSSKVYKVIEERFEDAQLLGNGRRPAATWPARMPMRRPDHIFVSEQLEVIQCFVVNSALSRVASEHLPVVADIRLRR